MSDNQSDVFTTIMAFEQVLEVMPDDREALESVANAYEELGDHIQAKTYIMRLVRVLIDEGDIDAAAAYADKLRAHAAEDHQVVELIEEVETLCGGGTGAAESQTPEKSETAEGGAGTTIGEDAAPETEGAGEALRKSVHMTLNVKAEIAFAWNLLQVELLSQEEYDDIVRDLTELASGNLAGPVSVLHVMRDRGFRNIEKILAAVARDTYMPLVRLHQFDIQLDLANILPLEFIVNRGAMPFERIGPEIMTALLNPYDEPLREDVADLAGCTCHWFLTTPEEFDGATDRIRKLIAT